LVSNIISTGAKYHTRSYERKLQQVFTKELLIDAAGRKQTPKLFVTTTKMNFFPATPFLMRSYGHKEGTVSSFEGSCDRHVWEAVRATSAAPSLFEMACFGTSRRERGAQTRNCR